MIDTDPDSKLIYMHRKVQLDPLVINFQELTITNPQLGTNIPLRLKEAELLALLCWSYPKVLTRTMIIEELWSTTYATDLSINQLINSVRKKLGFTHKPIVKTIPKIGYKLQLEPTMLDKDTNRCNSPINLLNTQNGDPFTFNTLPKDINNYKRLFNIKFSILCFSAVLLGAIFGRCVHHFPFHRLQHVNGIPFTFEPGNTDLEKTADIDTDNLLFIDEVDGELYSCLKSYVCNKL
ncbi:winged helix-turn-helix domain-containing protein [Vibrio pectenicida]|uniref:Winged helix-turn-helix domain-containing protein n=1 Tax=Vibrio pectenicida TaxID=62763 RepID=A0A7Y4EF28_9VIBR|nr:winged helix-turn-helix domain-containing protein [Vibrio pectenicida]NOH71973.1 winged helix-turn-helix domain-containing protein [Vibrio pectenicida]